jgi:hypothetical protein
MAGNLTPGSDLAPWVSGWWRGRPYGSDDGTQVGFATLEVDLLGQPIARLWNWAQHAENVTDPAADAVAPLGEWDSQVWLRYDSIDGVVDHVLRTGEQTIVVSSTVPTADCGAVLVDAQTHPRNEMPQDFLAACFTALAASAPDIALEPAKASDAPDVSDARASSVNSALPEGPWQAVDLVGYLEAQVVAEAAGITRDDSPASVDEPQ